MATIFTLTTPEDVVPEPEFRPATEVEVDSYILMELRVDGDSASVLVDGLEAGVYARSAQYVVLDTEHLQALLSKPVLPADYADDLTTDQAATGGTVSSVVKTGAGWTAEAFTGKVITFAGGTNGNADGSVRAIITSNTTDTINFTRSPLDAFAAACDNTTTFRVHAGVNNLLRVAAMLLAMDQLGKAGSL